jgi:hypothetical protein
MTFASRMQHKIYWGPLKKPIEWSLKTVLAPWAYMASVLYHDTFWYPFLAKKKMAEVLDGAWGREVGDEPAEIKRTGLAAFWTSLKILGTCLKEAPELAQRRHMTTSAGK